MSHEFKKQARKGGSRCLYIILRSHVITLNTTRWPLRLFFGVGRLTQSCPVPGRKKALARG